MIQLIYAQAFVRAMKRLPNDLQEEALEKIELFRIEKNHTHLKVHKLKGRLEGRFSFSVNFKVRIIFQYLSPKKTVLLSIGDHDIYK